MENEELIRKDMEKTREALTDKLETLEKKVVSSVQQATSAVTDTVSTVKDTMQHGVESVKDAFDVRAHVERRPWLMLGGAVAAGFFLGDLLARRESRAIPPEKTTSPMLKPQRPQGNGHHRREREMSAAAAAPESSWLSVFEPELRKLKGLALGVTLGTLREAIAAEMPSHLADELGQVIDAMTEKIGGTPLPSGDIPFAGARKSSPAEEEGFFEPDQPRW